MQCERIGFNLKKERLQEDDIKYCEILNIVSKGNNIKTLLMMRSFLLKNLYEKNINFALTTSSKKMLRFYLRYGCSVLEERILPIGKKYIIKLDIS